MKDGAGLCSCLLKFVGESWIFECVKIVIKDIAISFFNVLHEVKEHSLDIPTEVGLILINVQ
jgi:hypothetical protein